MDYDYYDYDIEDYYLIKISELRDRIAELEKELAKRNKGIWINGQIPTCDDDYKKYYEDKGE